MLDESTGQLEAVVAEGLTLESLPRATRSGVAQGGGALRSALQSGAIVCRDPEQTRDAQEPVVAIPMRVLDRPIGVIAIYRFLSHKDEISLLDRELFTLLAGDAATAILAARLYSESKRKLNTIQGFIDLLTR